MFNFCKKKIIMYRKEVKQKIIFKTDHLYYTYTNGFQFVSKTKENLP